jgi:hypothetical protein
MKYFLEGLYIGWKNPVRKLTKVKWVSSGLPRLIGIIGVDYLHMRNT